MKFSFRIGVLALLLGAMCLATPPAYAGTPPARFVIFGDSLSDPGNYYAAYGEVSRAPYQMVPSAPYTMGGHHFSNGPTWAEQLTAALHTPDSGRPALVDPATFRNYAVGGARARPNGYWPYYDLGTQVASYLAATHNHADARAVHVVWFGGNDVRDALGAASADPTFATSAGILHDAVQATADNIVALWSAGARVFLVPSVPDFSRTPAMQALGAAAAGAAWQLSMLYNAGESAALDQLAAALPGIRIVRVDSFALVDDIGADPTAYGLVDGTTPCLSFGVVRHAVCEEPQENLFWDGIHPTTAAHHAIAVAMGAALGYTVPASH